MWKSLNIMLMAFSLISVSDFAPSMLQDVIATYWSADGSLIAYLHNGSLDVIDAVTGESVWLSNAVPSDIQDVDWHPNRQQIALGSENGTVIVLTLASDDDDAFEAVSLEMLDYGQYPDIDNVLRGVQDVAWSHDGRYLMASGMMNGITLKIWETGQFTSLLQTGAGVGPQVAWHPSKNMLVIASNIGLRTLDMDVFSESTEPITADNWQPYSQEIGQAPNNEYDGRIAWSNDGTRLAVADRFGRVWLVEVETGDAALFSDLNASSRSRTYLVGSLMWNEDDTRLYGAVSVTHVKNPHIITAVEYYAEVRVWDVDTGRVLETFQSDASYINGIDFNPRTRMLVFGDVPDEETGGNLLDSGAIRIVDMGE